MSEDINIRPYISLTCSASSQLARRIYKVIFKASGPLDIVKIRDGIGANPGDFGRVGSYYAEALGLLIQVGLIENNGSGHYSAVKWK